MRSAIEALDALAPSLIADYWGSISGPAGEPAFLDTYFAALARHAAERSLYLEELRRNPPPPGPPPSVPPPPIAGGARDPNKAD